MKTLSSGGQWPDVDYTTGCSAVRASWPAQEHWRRISQSLTFTCIVRPSYSPFLSIATLAAAYHGAAKFNAATAVYTRDPVVRAALTTAMDWWFANDFTNIACLDNGGNDSCPCGT